VLNVDEGDFFYESAGYVYSEKWKFIFERLRKNSQRTEVNLLPEDLFWTVLMLILVSTAKYIYT
jgi:hypothetical protein